MDIWNRKVPPESQPNRASELDTANNFSANGYILCRQLKVFEMEIVSISD